MKIFIPELGKKEINVFSFLNLIHKACNARNEKRWIMIVNNVHIDSMIAAGKEGFLVLLSFNVFSDSRENECSGEDGLQIPSGHLQD